MTSFLARECPKRSVPGERKVCALRSLLRYLHLAGLIGTPLVWAVPPVADLRDRTLPRSAWNRKQSRSFWPPVTGAGWSAGVTSRSCCCCRGLGCAPGRSPGCASMTSTGVVRGELLVRGKGGRHDLLPLPVDVGEAVVSYLSSSPSLRVPGAVLAGHRATPGTEPQHDRVVVRAACDRAGLARAGAHRLRHSAATRDAQAGGVARRDRPGATPPRPEDHRHLRQGRSNCIRRARAPVAVARKCGMTTLGGSLADYLQIRRRLGFEMPQDGRLLEGFVEFLDQAGASRITTELALAWARLPVDAHPHRWRQRLSVARGFARYQATIDPTSEVPSTDLLPGHRPRIAPTSTPTQRSER